MNDILAKIADVAEDYNSYFSLHGTVVDMFCQPKGDFKYHLTLETDLWELRYHYAWVTQSVSDIVLTGDADKAEFDLVTFVMLWENIEWSEPVI